MKLKLKKGDLVQVIAGNDKGAVGRILEIYPEKMRVLVEGVNVRKKHTKPSPQNPKGGIVSKEMPIHYSNVMILDSDKIAIKLSRGWHRLLFKVTQLSGEWGLSARIVDGEGNPIEDLRYSLIPWEGRFKGIAPYGWMGEAEPKGGEGFAFDRDIRTRWSSNRPMEPGMFYILDLGREEEISQIVLDSSFSPGDYPRGLRVEISLDKNGWHKIEEMDAEEVERRQWEGILGIDFPKVKARYIKLTQLGSHPYLFWSIHEIYLY